MNNWAGYRPVFECDRYCRPLYAAAPWSGLRPFVYDYCRNVRPENIVELGTHYGCSAFCFLQAMKDAALDTELTVIDTWEGDYFTVHDYQDDVFGQFSKILGECYGGCRIRIRRQRFSDAAADFAPGSISLLHMDGSHLYRDVRRDFEDWYEKVAEDGALFLHDITAERDGRLLGSGEFWREIEASQPYTLRIPYSCGLGILLRDAGRKETLEEAIRDPRYLRIHELENEEIKAMLRESWFAQNALK